MMLYRNIFDNFFVCVCFCFVDCGLCWFVCVGVGVGGYQVGISLFFQILRKNAPRGSREFRNAQWTRSWKSHKEILPSFCFISIFRYGFLEFHVGLFYHRKYVYFVYSVEGYSCCKITFEVNDDLIYTCTIGIVESNLPTGITIGQIIREIELNTNLIFFILQGKVLPKGSHVFYVGLADGAILYEALRDRVHPIGSLRNDVTYSEFYDYFNCLEVDTLERVINTCDICLFICVENSFV